MNIRNVAIIAHVDHGKTTLVDRLLQQSGMFRHGELEKLAGGQHGLILDSNPLERERGITIFSKNCAIRYRARDGSEYKINLVDTPGHADFGGEVERVLGLVDGVLLLVDAFEGPMPQTRFVLEKALRCGLKPIVVINKVDRSDSRPDAVVNEVFDLLVELHAEDRALDFTAVFASARVGWATLDLAHPAEDLRVILEAIVEQVPPPTVRPHDPLQMLVTTLDYSDFLGRIAIGRVTAGELRQGDEVAVLRAEGASPRERIQKLFQFEGLGRKEVEVVEAGDLCAVVGLDPIDIGDTIADPQHPRALPRIVVDEPTLHMTFRVNNGPFAGQQGDHVTSRKIRERLDKERQVNVALRVSQGDIPEEFLVSGRGLMHLGILLENMRREGYELSVGKPRVIRKIIDGRDCEPIELLAVECPTECQSAVVSLLGDRRAEMIKVEGKEGVSGYLHIEFTIPARGLIGLRSRMLTATRGRAVMHHTFRAYEPFRGAIPDRTAGVLVASETGQVTAYALDSLYDRGIFFVRPGEAVYEGQVVGEHCKDNDLGVNVTRAKKLTNVRASGKDDASQVRPIREIGLEEALEYVQGDELVEITPTAIRLRKKILRESDRRREGRRSTGAGSR